MSRPAVPGSPTMRLAVAGTGLFVVVSAAGVVSPVSWGTAVLVVDATLAAAGCAAFLVGYGRALKRSRTESVGVAALFFLPSAVAPPPVRRVLLGCLGVQVAGALAAAFARPYTTLAAGVLVPVYGLGLVGLWAARHGSFPSRAGR
ncbi:MAG: hypothetical protein ACRD0Q_09625 [Acidimicrobiales bacterium]